MKYIQAMLAVAGLLIGSGAIGAARADDRGDENEGVSLYTPVNIGDYHRCQAVNVGDKTLGITIELINAQGRALSCDSPNTCTYTPSEVTTTNPTPEVQALAGTVPHLQVTLPLRTPQPGYCVVAVSGTDNRDDVRVSLLTFGNKTIPGTTIPIYSRIVEGH